MKDNISVCMAVFNGKKYLNQQIISLISQTNKIDELVIIDDSSSDDSLQIISSVKSIDIKLSLNDTNLGHVKTFEKGLNAAIGDIIFLSDQDDVWMENKISAVKEIFDLNPSVNLVHHELLYVDENLSDLNNPLRLINFGLQNRLKFLLMQLYKPELFGCGIAIRKSLIEKLLPFPSCVYAHDHWLSIIAALHGDVYMSPLQLVKYRQHNSNLTPKNKNKLSEILKLRIKFTKMIFIALYRKIFKND